MAEDSEILEGDQKCLSRTVYHSYIQGVFDHISSRLKSSSIPFQHSLCLALIIFLTQRIACLWNSVYYTHLKQRSLSSSRVYVSLQFSIIYIQVLFKFYFNTGTYRIIQHYTSLLLFICCSYSFVQWFLLHLATS